MCYRHMPVQIIYSLITIIRILTAYANQVTTTSEINCLTEPESWGCHRKHGSCTLWKNHPQSLPRQFLTEYYCECKPQWNGPKCEHRNPCSNNPCGLHGTCHRLSIHPLIRAHYSNDYHCTCQSGIAESSNDYIDHIPLQTDSNKAVFMYDGKNCTEYVADYCRSSPCQNGGSCYITRNIDFLRQDVITQNMVQCKCADAWTGAFCEIPIGEIGDDCRGMFPCMLGRGSCDLVLSNETADSERNVSSRAEEYQCQCSPEFVGKQCERDVMDCRSRREEYKCHNNANCVELQTDDGNAQYACLCKDANNKDPQCREAPVYNWTDLKFLPLRLTHGMLSRVCRVVAAPEQHIPVGEHGTIERTHASQWLRHERKKFRHFSNPRSGDRFGSSDLNSRNPCMNNAECLISSDYTHVACICQNGTSGNLCGAGCPFGWYGEGCEHPCSRYCAPAEDDDVCHPGNGSCRGGCSPGYTNDQCSRRDAIEVSLKMRLSGTYQQSRRRTIAQAINAWAKDVCIKIGAPCSVDIKSVYPARAIVEYVMLFNPTPENKARNLRSDLDSALKNNYKNFKIGRRHPIEQSSIEVRGVSRTTEKSEANNSHWHRGVWLTAVGILALVVITSASVWYKRMSRKRYFLGSQLAANRTAEFESSALEGQKLSLVSSRVKHPVILIEISSSDSPLPDTSESLSSNQSASPFFDMSTKTSESIQCSQAATPLPKQTIPKDCISLHRNDSSQDETSDGHIETTATEAALLSNGQIEEMSTDGNCQILRILEPVALDSSSLSELSEIMAQRYTSAASTDYTEYQYPDGQAQRVFHKDSSSYSYKMFQMKSSRSWKNESSTSNPGWPDNRKESASKAASKTPSMSSTNGSENGDPPPPAPPPQEGDWLIESRSHASSASYQVVFPSSDSDQSEPEFIKSDASAVTVGANTEHSGANALSQSQPFYQFFTG